ncbi:MAG: hypothetical protein AAB320_07880 [Elusimicrobiota bacterium]
MAEQEPFDAWLSDFKKEVDSSVGTASPSVAQAARDANAAFDNWWKSEHEAPGTDKAPSRFLDEAAPVAPAPVPAAEEMSALAERLQAVVEQKAALEHLVSKLSKENSELRQNQMDAQARLSDFENKLSRAREGYEGHIGKLDAQVRLLEEQAQSLRKDREFLEGAFHRLEGRNKSLEEESRLHLEKNAHAEKGLLELRRKLSDGEAELAKLRVDDAAKAGALLELRKQSSVYQDRLVVSSQHVDSDVTLLRQELRDFLIKVKRVYDEGQDRK